MEQENILNINVKGLIAKVFQISIFIALAVAVPYLGNQLITGSVVNALLFISVSILGLESAFLLCLIPSLISIYTGLLPLALAPMIPFIITGNALLVLAFYKVTSLHQGYGEARNFWTGAIPAILAKCVFIWLAGIILTETILKGEIAKNILLVISWPQLATAIAGACIAYLFLKTIKKNIIKK